MITSDNQTLSDLDWVIQNANDSSLPLTSHFYYNYGLALFNSFGTVSGNSATLRNAERLMVAAKTRTPEEDHVYIIHSEILKTAKQYNQAYNMLAVVVSIFLLPLPLPLLFISFSLVLFLSVSLTLEFVLQAQIKTTIRSTPPASGGTITKDNAKEGSRTL
jgi:hypothetical protein